jgi:hypothetical protein
LIIQNGAGGNVTNVVSSNTRLRTGSSKFLTIDFDATTGLTSSTSNAVTGYARPVASTDYIAADAEIY